MENSKRNRKKNGCAVRLLGCLILIVSVVCLAVGSIFVMTALNRHKEKAQQKYITQWQSKGITIALEGAGIPSQYIPIIEENEIYYTVAFVKEYIDNTIFWDESTQKLTVTNANSVIRMGTNDLTYYVNNEPLTLEMTVRLIEEEIYIPARVLENLYGVVSQYNEKEAIVSLDYKTKDRTTAQLANKTKLLEGPSTQDQAVKKLKQGESVMVYETQGDYTNIRTAEGIPGYVLSSVLTEASTTKGEQAVDTTPKAAWKPKDGKITMVWDQIMKTTQNSMDSKRVEIPNLDVLSPTWFAIADSDGNISNKADEAYVKWAHDKGYQVWGLLSNSFDAQITHDVLSNTDLREKVIKQVLALAAIYDLDGINIDFESVASADGIYYVQFIREITPYLKAQGLTVSVDMYVPRPYNTFYSMQEVGQIVDYVVVMAYDQHWGTSPDSGSVATLWWTEDGVKNSLSMVPAEKLIMGIPFYTRVWEEKTVDGKKTVSSSSLGMQGGLNDLKKNGATIAMDQDSGQNYGSYEKDGALYRIWVEDLISLEKRMQLIEEYDLAGCAGWKRGLEMNGTWDVINRYLK